MTFGELDRLGPLDVEFLHIEDDVGHMHIGGACVFDGPSPSFEDLWRLVESKLHLIPRYRQRVRTVPLELGRPVWVDDPGFNLNQHLRHTELLSPGGDVEFRRFVGEVMSRRLDRDRPLWEVWLVNGLEADRWALVCKVHHCMVDGISGVGLLTVLLDITPEVDVGDPEPWEPSPEPNAAAKVLGTWKGLGSDIARQTQSAASALSRPGDVGHNIVSTLRGVARLGGAMKPTPRLTIDGRIGPDRSWAHSSASFDDVRAIRQKLGGTVNDVVLSAITAGYAELLRQRGDDISDAVVRSMVPVSTRHLDDDGVPNNEVSLVLFELPVKVTDPLECFAAVRAEMAELKTSNMIEAGEVVTTIGELAPPMAVGTLSRWIVRGMHRLPQRSINTVTTNVPGPQFPIYCLGREMRSYLPFVPVTHGVRISTAVLSYNGNLFFGITGDAESVPEVEVIAERTAEAIRQLRERAERS